MAKKKDVFENYTCEHQLSFQTIDMEIKEDEEWERTRKIKTDKKNKI